MVDSKVAKELEIKLRKLWDNDNYVKGIIAFAKTEKNIITISQFIDMSYQLEKDITADDISFLLEVLENKS
ncbi:hypothetical protein [uncultured Solobacterium sp.]|jgi:hypothetical protein|uniref:hypothetical protein n=1 Tax=uncultured Solobacterium sp. TaxID=747375 RepID=UPI0026096120|nr:hypothetical protein [uncultured Solobacterium sp.]